MQALDAGKPAKFRIGFVYLGRNPGFGGFVLDLAKAARDVAELDCHFIVADHTELAQALRESGAAVAAIETFYKRALPEAVYGFYRARRRIIQHLALTEPDFVVTLMPHVWSPLISNDIKRRGWPYATVIHDAQPHPGDPTALLTRWLTRDTRNAERIVALSGVVAGQLAAQKGIERARIVQLFHPDLGDGRGAGVPRRQPHQPLRVLFFGRIMAYKGLSLLVEAVTLLRQRGVKVDLGVAGVGGLGRCRRQLEALGAEIIERWVPRREIAGLLERYDAMACSHIEASQSGVAALAFGAGMPVIAAPVGGLAEQVVDGQSGVLAREASAPAFADAIERLATEPGLYDQINQALVANAGQRSMQRFLSELVAALAAARAGSRR